MLKNNIYLLYKKCQNQKAFRHCIKRKVQPIFLKRRNPLIKNKKKIKIKINFLNS